MSYDSRGNLTQTVDAGKRRINFTYDIFNNLTSLSINGRTRLKNHYDSKGNLTGTTDALGNRTTIKMTYSEGQKKSHMQTEAALSFHMTAEATSRQ